MCELAAFKEWTLSVEKPPNHSSTARASSLSLVPPCPQNAAPRTNLHSLQSFQALLTLPQGRAPSAAVPHHMLGTAACAEPLLPAPIYHALPTAAALQLRCCLLLLCEKYLAKRKLQETS